MKKKNFNKFSELRITFPFFKYESFEYEITEQYLSVKYHFNLSDQHYFHPTLKLEKSKYIDFNRISKEHLEVLLFHIGMVETISYWKTSCSPKLIISDFRLTNEQEQWWQKLFHKGLGEFFFLNGISIKENELFQFSYETDKLIPTFTTDSSSNQLIVPIGGGKDSIVSIELLKEAKEVLPLILNPRPASLATIKQSGVPQENAIFFKRTIDPELIKLNNKGFLNGHTPFSALLAFVTLLAANLSGSQDIALSNESSANEPTNFETNANHQYSKSYEFENDFRNYVKENIQNNSNYFSFLRPLSEYQIAKIFSSFPSHFKTFKSCNVGSKQDIWCGNCSKCLFTYIILSPFIKAQEMISIFGENLLDKKELKPIFNELIGNTESKPFECVGTIDEIQYALQNTLQQQPLPYLLKDFQAKMLSEMKISEFTDETHFLKDEYIVILREALQK